MPFFETVAGELSSFAALLDTLDSGKGPMLTVGLAEIHKAHWLKALANMRPDRPLLVITPDELAARKLAEDINAMGGEQPIAMLYPEREWVYRQVDAASKEYEYQRIGVLSAIAEGRCPICLCSIHAFLQPTLPPKVREKHAFSVKLSDTSGPQALAARLAQAGYVRREQVDGAGQFAVRGGIVDVFSVQESAPVRIEYWGDDIDSMSYFDLTTQRRTVSVESFSVSPTGEVLFDSPDHLLQKLQALQKKTGNAKAKEVLLQDVITLQEGRSLTSLDKYMPLAYEKPACLLDYYDPSTVVVALSEWQAQQEQTKSRMTLYQEEQTALWEEGQLCKELSGFVLSFSEAVSRFAASAVWCMDVFAHHRTLYPNCRITTQRALQTAPLSGELRVLAEELSTLQQNGRKVCLLAGTRKAAVQLCEDLKKQDIDADSTADLDSIPDHWYTQSPAKAKVMVLAGRLSYGFEYPESGFAVLSLGGAQESRPKHRRRYAKGKTIRRTDELAVGDFVVHAAHGIGVFDGVHQITVQGVVKDYLKIRYAGADTLYVPVTQLDLVTKYIAPAAEDRVKLNRLHSGEWQKTKARVSKACAQMAEELTQLYAKRMQTPGFSFSEDTPWQREFEDRFPYEETDDQLRCVQEIKADMERGVPMDRLLCGDVGFGKTEVALRAAFKCIMDSKQCVLLCPTTILAWQHYQTALERFAAYPIKVGLLSRFCTPSQRKELVQKLGTGEVDLVIGTHRLLQKDIAFHDLGLVIIDEEQRFGVAQKERFKKTFTGVDLLNLSATPIPRTLNFAMTGIWDMSVIEQPPQDRHPVQTYVMEYDAGVLADAIRKELRRGGQVYYLHNRVESIELCAAKIQQWVPEASIGVAHGKMNEKELSEVWRQLLEQEIQILVCTTIVEAGVDIKNCNTLIIEQADRFGLAQLYQLRGRVGRSNRRAFAYFTFQRGKVLSEIATKRLTAIREFTAFGSGFRIAMRDLEIRGAGDLLGGKQHGHMEAVGYDMYVRLLSEAVAAQKGEVPQKKAVECLIDVPIDAHIPVTYIETLSQRLEIYQKTARIQSVEERMDLLDELIDRFGAPPEAVTTLLEVALIRNILAKHGFAEITQRGNTLILYPEQLDMDTAQKLTEALPMRVRVNAGTKPSIAVAFARKQNTLQALQLVAGILEEKG